MHLLRLRSPHILIGRPHGNIKKFFKEFLCENTWKANNEMLEYLVQSLLSVWVKR